MTAISEVCDTERPDAAGAAGTAAIRRILIADDSRLQRRILATSLIRWGFEVVEAGSGDEALQICETSAVDLVLSDWMMPGLDGLEFCRALRARGGAAYVYFILLTSKSEKDEIAEGLDTGADDFLTKPVNADELRARITAADRILRVERELTQKNRVVTETLGRLRALYDAIDRDLVEARKLQHSLVPRRTLSLPGAEISFLFQPAGHVGGDLVGHFQGPPGQVGIYSIDVSGHGIASALITARLAARLAGGSPDRNIALEWRDGAVAMRPPDEICGLLNRQFLEEIETEHYLTVLLAEVDLASGRVRFAQAGHPPALCQRRDGRIEFLGEGGLPVGLIDGASYAAHVARLAPGDRLFLYSDGISECPTPDGGMLDEDGLARLFRRHRALRGTQVLDALCWELNKLTGGGDLPDDVSGVLLEFGQAASA